jgi:hypothetical protein
VESTKPCILLLPCWVAKKTYFSKLFGCRDNQIFFIAPLQRYNYTMPPDLVPESCKPSWVGDDGQTSPFQSCWYVYLPPPFKPGIFFENLKCNMAKSGPFDCVLAKRLQSVKWKLKKTRAQGGQGRPEAECLDQEKRKRKKHRQKCERPAVPGTVEFD